MHTQDEDVGYWNLQNILLKDPAQRVGYGTTFQDPHVREIVLQQKGFDKVVIEILDSFIATSDSQYSRYKAVGCSAGAHRAPTVCAVTESIANAIWVDHFGQRVRLFNVKHFWLSGTANLKAAED